MKDLELNGPWRFRLKRLVMGFTIPTVVADGVRFKDGTCVLRWRYHTVSTAVYTSHADLMAVHGHGGATECIWVDTPPTRAFEHGASNCAQDGMENSPFASIGGLDARQNPVPKFARPGEEAEWLRGYIACARASYGDDWETCTFEWAPALTIGGDQ